MIPRGMIYKANGLSINQIHAIQQGDPTSIYSHAPTHVATAECRDQCLRGHDHGKAEHQKMISLASILTRT